MDQLDIKTFTITFAGSERTFTLRPYCLRLKAWYRRLRTEYCRAKAVPESADIVLGDLLEFVLDSERRTNDCMQNGWDGDHTGIDWYTDVDPDSVEGAVLGFFVGTVRTHFMKTNASPTSSAPTARASASRRKPSAQTSSRSKKQRTR